jgi:MerR family transcriptional regulator, redox-sensitive transcriptional activator SoxR
LVKVIQPGLSADLTELTVGQLARRSGVAVSAIHFYEAKGLIRSRRTTGNQRRYARDVLRRVAVIKVAQRLGIPLSVVREAIQSLPLERSPSVADWTKMSLVWRGDLDERITKLTRLRDELSNCIGCGCLSLDSCPLYNPRDELSKRGPGSQLLDPE